MPNDPTTANSGLSEIIVTAQRRSENLQRAAIAVTAVTGDALIRAGVTDTTQLTRVAPALQIGTVAGSTPLFYLRGVGNFTVNALADSAVSFNLDGVPLVRSVAIQGLIYDLERVEVLKGPQGTLYGRNATGGAINLITAKPVAGDYSGYLNGEYSNFDTKRITAALNVPGGDSGAFRIAGIYSDHGPDFSDGTGAEKLRAVRAQVARELTNNLKVSFGGDFTRATGTGPGSTLNGFKRSDRIGLGDPRIQAVFARTYLPVSGTFMQPLTADNYQNNKFFGIFAQADWTTPIGTLTVLPSYRDAKVFDHTIAPAFNYYNDMKSDQTTVEMRLASDGSGPLNYILGGFFLNESVVQKPGYVQQSGSFYLDLKTNTKSYAGFGRLTYKLTDSLRVTGGARYTIDDKSADINSLNLILVCPASFAGGNCIGTPTVPVTSQPPPQVFLPDGSIIPVQPYGTRGAILATSRVINNGSQTFKKATWRAAVEYDVRPQSLLYASVETGFKAGGFFSSVDRNIYDPEKIIAYTVGSKNRFLDNRVQVNLEAFWWDYKDQQVSHFRINSLGASEFITENIGRTRLRGFEIETRARVLTGTTVYATAQYLDAKYKNFVYTNPASAGPPITGCGTTLSGAIYVIDCAGKRPANAPKWALSGGVEQTVELGSAGQLILNADARYQSNVFTGFEITPAQLQKAYAMLDLQAQYILPGGNFSITGFVNNVTDKNVVGFTQPFPFQPSLVPEVLRPPRTYGVRAGYKF